ncbi:MAG: N-acetyl-gamma-glutamyl-phosphate reductase [Phycisphaeraceae bacterium]|nr:N-acetyl-gamma-glutamyl-phosphate reductase [Phycisphaeraceae bacterium]
MSIRVAIIGPTSYTGLELIRILLRHPRARISYLASARAELPNIADEFPQLTGRCDMTCRPLDPAAIAAESDVAFVCLPHVAAMEHVPRLLEAGIRVIDLSADYRLTDAELYQRVYGHAHTDRMHLGQAVYGLPELFRLHIEDARLVANPGCYPTSVALACAPLLQRGMVGEGTIIANSASGVSGAGRSPKPNLHFPEVNEAYSPYNVGIHRHQPEMEQTLSRIRGREASVLFVPHLLPVTRGILSTVYLEPADDQISEEELFSAFEDAYGDEPFIRLRKRLPDIRDVRDTNFCDLAVRLVKDRIVVFAAIDNLVKGASGQAVQNMNLVYGIDETAGLLF